MPVTDYSTTPGSNIAISGISLAEGCNASGINDAIRQMMADIATMITNGTLPSAGDMKFVAGAAAPSGWLLCNGAAVSRATYSALFTAITTTYGVGDGSTTFNLPDIRGRTLVGVGAGVGLTNRALGATGGEESHLLVVGEVPSLSVTGSTAAGGAHTPTLNDPGHTHTYNEPVVQLGAPFTIGTNNLAAKLVDSALVSGGSVSNITANAVADHTHTLTGTTTGGGGTHNNMPPFFAGNICIKT